MRHITASTRNRIMQLWAVRDRFLSTSDRLPQTFSHLDFQRRNLLIRSRVDHGDELVAVDWERCGIAPLGADLAFLVGMSCLFFEWEPMDAQNLDGAAFDAYLSGLRDAGWQGDAHLARLGYLVWIAIWLGVIMSSAIDAFTEGEDHVVARRVIGRVGDDLASGWSKLGEFALDCADEARPLMDRLHSV
jgi:thiamine kinase-like enzyme